jgi:hypothetical protein
LDSISKVIGAALLHTISLLSSQDIIIILTDFDVIIRCLIDRFKQVAVLLRKSHSIDTKEEISLDLSHSIYLRLNRITRRALE